MDTSYPLDTTLRHSRFQFRLVIPLLHELLLAYATVGAVTWVAVILDVSL